MTVQTMETDRRYSRYSDRDTLSPRQRQVLALMLAFQRKYGRLPRCDEILARIRRISKNVVYTTQARLIEKGYLQVEPAKANARQMSIVGLAPSYRITSSDSGRRLKKAIRGVHCEPEA